MPQRGGREEEMLETLLESNAPRQRRRASIGIHTAAIVGAVVATGSAKPAPIRLDIPMKNRPVYVRPTQSPSAEPSLHGRVGGDNKDLRPMPRVEPVVLTYLPKPGSRLGDVDPAALLSIDSLGPGTGVGRIGVDSDGPV